MLSQDSSSASSWFWARTAAAMSDGVFMKHEPGCDIVIRLYTKMHFNFFGVREGQKTVSASASKHMMPFDSNKAALKVGQRLKSKRTPNSPIVLVFCNTLPGTRYWYLVPGKKVTTQARKIYKSYPPHDSFIRDITCMPQITSLLLQ